jgi:hypothetical protein
VKWRIYPPHIAEQQISFDAYFFALFSFDPLQDNDRYVDALRLPPRPIDDNDDEAQYE